MAKSGDEKMSPPERALWSSIRQGLIIVVNAIGRYIGAPPVRVLRIDTARKKE